MGDEAREWRPAVLNAANGKPDDGATFEYVESLGTERVLVPGAISGPVRIRLRLKDPLRVPDMQLVVAGFVER
jgi:hypothetical protein